MNSEIKQIIRLCESENGTFEKVVDIYNTVEIYLVALLLLVCLYVQLYTATIYIIIAIIAVIIAIVDYKKQVYEDERS